MPIIQEYLSNSKNENLQYIEPFAGGMNVIDKINKPNNHLSIHKIASDKNKYLIALWKHIQSGYDLLPEVSRELYNDVRDNVNTGKYADWCIGNVGFLASYNGRFFDGGYAPSGYEKTKTGLRLRDYYQEAKNNILKQSSLIKDVDFICYDYNNLNLENVDVVYCDPPYQNTKQYANSKDFDYNSFWNTMRLWSENNGVVLISELNAPDDFECIWEKSVSRSIKVTDKSVAVEKLFKYKY